MSTNGLRLNQKNMYRALWEFAHGTADVKSTPPNLQLARSNICNFQCVYCIEHRLGNQVPRFKLEGQVWQQLLELIPRSTMLAFHGIGEFMIDPEFFDIVRRCAEVGASLSLNINASVCTPEHLDALVNLPGFVSVTFSLDAATPDTFMRIRGQDFWRIVRNIKAYIDHFEARRDRTWFTLSFVIMKSSVKEMVPLVYLGKSLKVDEVKYYRLHEYDGLDWQVQTKVGDIFDYRKECTKQFGQAYNREIENTRRAAEALGVKIALPALLTEAELQEEPR